MKDTDKKIDEDVLKENGTSFYCQKYNKYFSEEDAKCPSKRDYCQYRTACIINHLIK
ncbi:hypothetical protein ACFL2A_05945 [Thermodesulfobacteriota bacterium]